MKDERRMVAAWSEFVRLVRILDKQDWYEGDPEELEQLIGRKIVRAEGFKQYREVQAAFDVTIVEVMAYALEAGVSQKDLVAGRGWLSHNDMQGYLSRARRPYSLRPEIEWAQWRALTVAASDIRILRDTEPAAAAGLARSARTFFRRWIMQIPPEPTETYLAEFASMWRQDHVDAWVRGRKDLVKRVEDLVEPKSQP